MPNKNTFEIEPISGLLHSRIGDGDIVIDPFARNSKFATIRNDLNPSTDCEHHMLATDFCDKMIEEGVCADIVLFDPPYSPRQISECYKAAGLTATMKDTQNSRLYRAVRRRLSDLLKPGGLAISFGWNTSGFGKLFDIEEIMIVCHGGAHNDTLCVVNRKHRDVLL